MMHMDNNLKTTKPFLPTKKETEMNERSRQDYVLAQLIVNSDGKTVNFILGSFENILFRSVH